MTVVDGLVILFDGLGKVIDDFETGHFKQMSKDWDNTWQAMEDSASHHANNIKNTYEDLGHTIAKMVDGAQTLTAGTPEKKEEKKGGKGFKGQTDEEKAAQQAAADQQIQLDQLQYTTEAQLLKIGLQTKKDALAEEVAQGKISKEQEIQQLKELADEDFKIDDDMLQHELANGNLSVVQKQRILDQISVLTAKHAADEEKLNLQLVTAQQKQWQDLEKTISSSMNTMLQGVLQGTQTWQQAVGNLFSNLASTLVKNVADMAVHWAVMEASKTAATVAGDATRTTSSVTAAATSKAANVAGAESSVGAHAASSAASVYSSVAAIPYVGWLLAPPAAAAAFVAVEAFGSGIASASGGYDIPAGVNPITQLHQNEMVLPADLANKVRNVTDNGGQSGGDTHIHITAIDTQSGMQFIKDNAASVAAAVQAQMRNANPNVSSLR